MLKILKLKYCSKVEVFFETDAKALPLSINQEEENLPVNLWKTGLKLVQTCPNKEPTSRRSHTRQPKKFSLHTATTTPTLEPCNRLSKRTHKPSTNR
jgi:hypothetical protein